jgi:hypothetical protein
MGFSAHYGVDLYMLLLGTDCTIVDIDFALEMIFSPTWFLIVMEYFGLRCDDLSFGCFSQFSVSLLTRLHATKRRQNQD